MMARIPPSPRRFHRRTQSIPGLSLPDPRGRLLCLSQHRSHRLESQRPGRRPARPSRSRLPERHRLSGPSAKATSASATPIPWPISRKPWTEFETSSLLRNLAASLRPRSPCALPRPTAPPPAGQTEPGSGTPQSPTLRPPSSPRSRRTNTWATMADPASAQSGT